MRLDDAWEAEAERWAHAARKPGYDSYWHFNRDAFLSLLPTPPARVLDLGCGEGRLSRDLKRLGFEVVGIDASPTLIRYAREADPQGDYRVASATELPFDGGWFELVVAFNTLMDLDDMFTAVREVWRVSREGGALCISVTHPATVAGKFESAEPDAPFVFRGSYFASERISQSFEQEGVSITFHSLTHSLEEYARALEEAGFCIEAIREPRPPTRAIAERPAYRRWLRMPMFLHVRARRT